MKKLPSLHILNGDASLKAFETANFPGQVLVWREILSEGPAIGSLPEQEFWHKRQQYITTTYNETPENYRKKVLNELDKLNNAHAFFEVILWFDADLMCQINLLYLLQKLDQIKPAVVSVCTPGKDASISRLTAEELHRAFETRQMQTKEQLQQAKKLWELYAGPDPLKLQTYQQQHRLLHPYLGNVLSQHLRRFPDCETGLSEPETSILQLINNGASSTQNLMQQFWQQQPGYGFGDWQLQILQSNLTPELIQQNEYLSLTEKGEQLLNGRAKYQSKPQWLGGTQLDLKQKWCYNNKKQLLASS